MTTRPSSVTVNVELKITSVTRLSYLSTGRGTGSPEGMYYLGYLLVSLPHNNGPFGPKPYVWSSPTGTLILDSFPVSGNGLQE